MRWYHLLELANTNIASLKSGGTTDTCYTLHVLMCNECLSVVSESKQLTLRMIYIYI